MENCNQITYKQLSALDPIAGFSTTNYRLARFAYNDYGNNATALLNIRTQNIISYSLTGYSEYKRYIELTNQ